MTPDRVLDRLRATVLVPVALGVLAHALPGQHGDEHGSAAHAAPHEEEPHHEASAGGSSEQAPHGPTRHERAVEQTGRLLFGGRAPIFEVHRRGDQHLVDADCASVTIAVALEQLATEMGWRLLYESEPLERSLLRETVNLSLSGESPERLAQLIAVAGGADIQISVPPVGLGRGRTQLMVVRPPTAASDEGRVRLRRWSADWYRTFLQDPQRSDPLVDREGVSARMHLATMLMQTDDFEPATRWFREVADGDRSHPFRPQALLKLAQCDYELWAAAPDAEYGNAYLQDAETYLAELSGFHPSIPETAAGAVLYGRVLIALGRYRECVSRMRDHAVKLAQMPEIVDIHLLIGEAQRRLGSPGEALVSTDNVAIVQQFVSLRRRQWLDFLFLRGWALTELDRPAEALGQLELFLGMQETGEEDPRQGQVLVILTRAYLNLGRYLEARSAALATFPLRETLDPEWRSDALELEARTRIAIGERREALAELEARLAGQTPFELETDLGLFLIREYASDGSFQKGMRVADMLIQKDVAELHPEVADEARFLRIDAMYQQAERDGLLRNFPARAIEHAEQLVDSGFRRRASELVGQAWLRLGDSERAADALRGLLRR